ncbi:MAG TPA: toll/interleukin-1 receptor domain-containing protein [Chthoniobacteraceae bacterium]|jgi:hypothetical protein|nr:toll/interleukin-1 receptor domain-containing protein [Chthoniobacteraceae bacterium]
MANPEHLAVLAQGVLVWNRWRDIGYQTDPEDPDLCAANLSGLDLTYADFTGVNFRDADIRDTKLCETILADADLTAANLAGAWLNGADVSGAKLSAAVLAKSRMCARFCYTQLDEADLTGADLCYGTFHDVDFLNTDFSNVTLAAARFTNCDLSNAKALESVIHYSPTSIGLDTIYKSRGKIPESFLRGCGVPESFITQMRALVHAEDGIQFYSCFISHSTKDAEFATRLHGKMRDAHLRVWYAPEDIKGGEKLHEQLETAIRSYDKLLIVLSEASLQSTWVQDELRKAFREEYESAKAGRKKRKLFPVRLCDYPTLERWECRDSRSGIDLAEEVRQYYIPDFSHWKEHDQFEASFARLLKDLKADEPGR